MNNKKLIPCMSDNGNGEENECTMFVGGKCKDIDCMYKDLAEGGGTYTLNNFKRELTKRLIDLISYVKELDKEYENTLRFNFNTYRIKLKIERE